MTTLFDHVRATGALAPEIVEAALQRQRIYGGSFDTALLELELVEPVVLDAWLAVATGLPAAPHALLKPGPTRPWDAVPPDILATGWVMPLAFERGRALLVVHPEISDVQLAVLRRAVPSAEIFVTAECCLARIASERSAAVVPQRYAVLSVAYVQSLRQAATATAPHAAATGMPPVAPWLSSPQSAPHFAAGGPTGAASGPMRAAEAPTARTTLSGTVPGAPMSPPVTFQPAVVPRDAGAVPERTGPRLQAPPVRGTPPLGQPPEHVGPGSQGPARVASVLPGGRSPIEPKITTLGNPLTTPVHGSAGGFVSGGGGSSWVGAPSPTSTPDAPRGGSFVMSVRDRVQGQRRALAEANHRDDITSSLLGCAAELTRRCALFGIKREGLRGLEGIASTLNVDGRVVALDAILDPVLTGAARLERCRHGPLAQAVQQSRDVPCIFEPVRVLDRPVLMLYLDRDGGAFSDDERALVGELCELAGQRLGLVLRQLREQSGASAPTSAPSTMASMAQRPGAQPGVILPGASSPASQVSGLGARQQMHTMMMAPGTHAPAVAPPVSPARGATPIVPESPLLATPSPLPNLVRPITARGSTLLGATPAPAATQQARSGGTTLPPLSGTLHPGGVVPTPSTSPAAHAPSVRIASPASPQFPRRDDAVPYGSAPDVGTSREPGWTPLEQDLARLGVSDSRYVGQPTFEASRVQTLEGALPPRRPAAEPSSAMGVRGAGQAPIGPGPATSSAPNAPAPQPQDRLLAAFVDDDETPSALPTATEATPPSAPSESSTSRRVVMLDDEDRQQPPLEAPLEARIDETLAQIGRGEAGLDTLLAFGEAGLRQVAQRFPGNLEVLRRDIDALPPPSAHGPLLRTCINLGSKISPFLLDLFDHHNAAIRFYAAFVFQELRDPQCLPNLADACFDAEAEVRTIAARVIETYSRHPSYESAVLLVRSELTADDPTRRLHAVKAEGTLRDTKAVPRLIELLEARERPLQEAALESLCTITGQQLGLKPQRWRTWFGEHGNKDRVEWLLATLEHKDVAVRRWGYDELRRITAQNIPFKPAAEPRDREASILHWREWWSKAKAKRR